MEFFDLIISALAALISVITLSFAWGYKTAVGKFQPQDEISSVGNHEESKEGCASCDYGFYPTSVYPCDECHCYSNFKQPG